MLVAERERQVGSFLVGRLLPFRKKRQVGPFTFIDHMGPSISGPGSYFDVDQHPHIGLSTLTYLIEGEVAHKDSTGADLVITPGSVNFMTSGKGCTHTERTPEVLFPSGASNPALAAGRKHKVSQTVHGYQVWVALPAALEEMEPRFDHVAAEDLPRWSADGLDFALIAGEGFGRTSPLPVHSPLFMVDVLAKENGSLNIAGELKGEIAIVVVTGEVLVGTDYVKAGEMLISETDNECCMDLSEGTRVLLFGGEPFPEARHLYWNFVSSRPERIEQAKKDWEAKKFPKVPGDDTYIPLPGK